MKSKRYSVEQVVAALKQHELGTPVADIARKPELARRRFTGGRSSMAVWSQARYGSSSRCARRTPGSSGW